MKKYKFEIKFENMNGGISTEYFSCKAESETMARIELSRYLLQSEHLANEIKSI